MARKKNTRRRRRGRGSFGPVLRLLSVVLTAVVIVVALTLFFKVENITVSGNSRYATEEIVAVSGVMQGDNLILLDKYKIAQKLYTELPYITNVRIKRDFPDGLKVEVTETHSALAIETGGAWWLVSENGKVLECTDAAAAQEHLLLRGMTAQGIAAGEQLVLSKDGNINAQRLLELIGVLRERGMLEKVAVIDAGNEEMLVIAYDGRFDVELRYDADFSFKMDCLKAAVNELEPNETGIIRMTMADENEVRLIPYGR